MPALITCDQDFGLVVVVFLRRQISGDKIALLCQEHLITTRTDQNGQIFCENPILLEEEMENPIQIQAHHVGWVCLYTDYGGNTKLGMIDQNSGQIIRTVEPTVDEPYKSVIGLGAWGKSRPYYSRCARASRGQFELYYRRSGLSRRV
jgi:hypothetical protein